MKRRGVIKTFLLSPAVLAWPAWAQSWNRDEVAELAGVFNESELKLLSAVADTIIPSGDSIGALSTQTDKFLARLISDCFDAEFQQEFKEQLQELSGKSTQQFAADYTQLTPPQREKLLLSLENGGDEDEQSFFEFIKVQTIRGFQTSEVVMTKYHGYSMAPGFYNGNVDV